MKTAVIVDSVRTGLAKSHRGGFNITRPDDMLAHIINAMLDIYIKYAEGNASAEELDSANEQLKQILKNLGLGLLIILPFSPITLPYIFSKAKELEIDLIPNWYKSLSNEDDRLE